MNRALFIGFDNCEYSKKAYEFLKICGFETTCLWAEPRRGSRMPIEIIEWSGEFLFHLKSYHILRKRLLDRVSVAAINFHPSPPIYPGAGGINWGLYNDDRLSGVTVHRMNEKIDNGDIIKFYSVDIFKNDTVQSLLDRVHMKQMEAFYDIVTQITHFGSEVIEKMVSEYSGPPWGLNVGRIKEIDNLENVDTNISEEELNKIVRATSFGRFGPKITLHGHTFQFKGVKK